MSLVKDLYPEFDEWGCSDYQPILELFGKILIQVDDKDYQGDSRIFYDLGKGKYGWLQFGWGSCSGCDALQRCGTEDDVESLIQELRDDIKEFGSREEALKFFVEHDWKGDYSYSEEDIVQKEFVGKVIAFLTGSPVSVSLSEKAELENQILELHTYIDLVLLLVKNNDEKLWSIIPNKPICRVKTKHNQEENNHE